LYTSDILLPVTDAAPTLALQVSSCGDLFWVIQIKNLITNSTTSSLHTSLKKTK